MNPDRAVLGTLPSPCYAFDPRRLAANAARLRAFADASAARMLYAWKAGSHPDALGLLRRAFDGAAVSSLAELHAARAWNGDLHLYAPAYRVADLETAARTATHIVVNSLAQWHGARRRLTAIDGAASPGLRIHPGVALAGGGPGDPGAASSRLGVPIDALATADLEGLSGVHVHALARADAGRLRALADLLEDRIPSLLDRVRWLNLGGGHALTDPSYDLEAAAACIRALAARHALDVFLEPGEAAWRGAGGLVCTVLDVVPGDPAAVLVDASVSLHLRPGGVTDPLPALAGSCADGEPGVRVRIGGISCLADDQAGPYVLPRVPARGERLYFPDTLAYTQVRASAFNGIPVPPVVACDLA